jgi:bacillithiol system protein YtxJ
MGLFNSIFSNSNNQSLQEAVNWINLTNLDEITDIKTLSISESIFIFKHSTRCGISRMVKKQFEKLLLPNKNNIKVYYLDLLKYRNVSDAVSEVFQVRHQSPQLLIIRNEVAVKHASHYDITTISINKYL